MRQFGPLLFTLVLCASAMFAQDQKDQQTSQAPSLRAAAPATTTLSASANPEPWRIVPETVYNSSGSFAEAPLANAKVPTADVDSDARPLGLDLSSRTLTGRDQASGNQASIDSKNEVVCYSIRSYLMARDSKDSDTTHLVGVSTCQPSRRYGLKTTDLRPHAPKQ